MPLPASRRRFLQLAGAGLAVAGSGLPQLGHAQPATAAAAALAPAEGAVLLNFNECPYGHSPAAQQAARDSIAGCGRYRFALAGQVRDAFIEQARIPADHARLYPGSSEPLNRAAVLWTGPLAGLVVADPTFETLGEVAAAHGAHVQKVPLRDDGAHDLRAMVAAAHARPTGLLYVCNPNNPTGSISPPDELAWLLAHKPASTRVLLDEAYLQYSEQPSLIAQVAQRDDLIVLRTFSKLYGMAGLRLGVAAAHPDRLRELASLGDNPLPVPALAAALASLRDPQLIPQRRLQNAKVRQATIAWLGKRGFSCVRSEANCFVVDVQRDGSAFAKAMADNGVVIGRSWPIWPQRVRVTVGTEEEMAAFRNAFAKVAGVPA
ncbi:pyridoxal phosphate-dependent aminotransferase [Stenotrophomonas sp. GD03819]|uniref:pyridoxal phosphate-dependent aminotransferase n=1 Tax=Stenotrophomonas sp. GD03819 TaxID=2975384 RepID=UPI002447F872|nr:pyridoxal phosphate-dependent aminotransferase [Stenotrophomonas sp. GD03819]MDH1790953.1 pyridoxal phosphate-dependent aminotransferase [Stenotrophomonas sp. GD03819]